MRISATQRAQNETRIRAAMDRLLDGQIPPGGKCDVKTLAREANVDRTAFYGARPYAHLREEFEQRLQALHAAGDLPDPRDAQIARMKHQIDTLRQRLTRRDQTILELVDIKNEALSRLAAQHDQITHLRREADGTSQVRRLPTRAASIGPCS
jgi:DNA-binding GntR family transcriptional regulator